MSNIRFDNVPSNSYDRAMFDLSCTTLTTANIGRLYPVRLFEVLPGDTWDVDVQTVIRSSNSFIKPIFTPIYYDVRAFFVPLRILYDKLEKVFGNDSPSAYEGAGLGQIPKALFNTNVEVIDEFRGTLADYFNCFTAKDTGGTVYNLGISVLPFRGFAKIWNYFYRNENIQNETYVYTGEAQTSGAYPIEKVNANEWSETNYFGKPPYVCKDRDYFTCCAPAPQKGQEITLSVQYDPTQPNKSYLPIFAASGNDIGSTTKSMLMHPQFTNLGFGMHPQQPYTYFKTNPATFQLQASDLAYSENSYPLYVHNWAGSVEGKQNKMFLGAQQISQQDWSSRQIDSSNLVANAGGLKIASIRDLTYAFQLQKMLERDMLFGSRYNEYLFGHYGVINPDYRVNQPEYLGGSRNMITLEQVAQTSASTSSAALGDLGAYSLSNGNAHFSQSFTEHGYIYVLMCIKQQHSYQYGLSPLWTRFQRLDFYDPLFANIGEQPVYMRELGGFTKYDDVFGYQEPWACYRFQPDIVTGQVRSLAVGSQTQLSLDMWHMADKTFTSRLDNNFIREGYNPDGTSSNLSRVLTVDPGVMDPFICDIGFNVRCARVMPAYSIPGFVDHN